LQTSSLLTGPALCNFPFLSTERLFPPPYLPPPPLPPLPLCSNLRASLMPGTFLDIFVGSRFGFPLAQESDDGPPESVSLTTVWGAGQGLRVTWGEDGFVPHRLCFSTLSRSAPKFTALFRFSNFLVSLPCVEYPFLICFKCCRLGCTRLRNGGRSLFFPSRRAFSFSVLLMYLFCYCDLCVTRCNPGAFLKPSSLWC